MTVGEKHRDPVNCAFAGVLSICKSLVNISIDAPLLKTVFRSDDQVASRRWRQPEIPHTYESIAYYWSLLNQ
jgi:hypothetical protein